MRRETLQSSYGGGVIQDIPRHELPAGSVWKMTDFIPNWNGEPLQKRGAWTKAYDSLGTDIKGVAWSPFASGSVLTAFTSDGHVWTLVNNSGVVAVHDYGSPATVAIEETQVGSNVAAQTEIQTISVVSSGGTFTASFNGQTTSALAYNASAATVQTALQGLSTIGSSNATVTVSTGNEGSWSWSTWTVTFAGSLANLPQELITVDGGSLGSIQGSAPTCTSSRLKKGQAGLVQAEEQVITVTATGGTFTLTYDGATTSALAWDASSATVQTAVQALAGGGTSVTGSAGGPYTVTFAGDAKEDLITGDSTNLTNTGDGPAIGTQRPVFFNDNLIAGQVEFDGVNTPKNMSSIFAHNSSAVAVYKSRLVTSDGNTLYFSNVLDHTAYDVDAFVTASRPIVGVAALSGMIMIFGNGSCERLRGTTPPSSTTPGDFVLEPAFNEGCIDPGSIVVYRDQVIWASENGVHMSDGAAITNLIEKGGIKQFWTTLMGTVYPSAGLDNDAGTTVSGIYGHHLVVSVITSDGVGTTFLYDFMTGRWLFFSNLKVLMFSESQDALEQLFMAVSDLDYVGEISSCFTTAGFTDSDLADPDGTEIAPSLELPFYRMGSGTTRFREFFLGVNIDNSDGGTGELFFDYVIELDALTSAYAAVNDDDGNPISVGTTDGPDVARIPVHFSANGMGLRITQTGGSRKTALYELEANIRVLEGRF